MGIWHVRGGNRLEGACFVQGSKNASLPILAASILAPMRCELHNVPQLRDVDAALPILRSPMELDGKPIRPAAVERVGDSILEITIHEGRNRQVRRMCAAAGLRVLRLTRISEGPLHLGSLAPGQWRRLTAEELELLRRL